MIKKLLLQFLCIIFAFALTGISPLIHVSKETKQLVASNAEDTYEVYKSGLPFRYLERSNISMSVDFNTAYFFLDVLSWYIIFNIFMRLYSKKTSKHNIVINSDPS